MWIERMEEQRLRRPSSGVVSCRLPVELKDQIEKLALSKEMPVSTLLKRYIEEAVRRGDPVWWDAGPKSFVEPLDAGGGDD